MDEAAIERESMEFDVVIVGAGPGWGKTCLVSATQRVCTNARGALGEPPARIVDNLAQFQDVQFGPTGKGMLAESFEHKHRESDLVI